MFNVRALTTCKMMRGKDAQCSAKKIALELWRQPEVTGHYTKNSTSISHGKIDEQCREFKDKLTITE